jgi:hypothetical protein
MYEPIDMIRKKILRSKLYQLKIHDDVGSLYSYLQKFKDVYSQFASVGGKMRMENLFKSYLLESWKVMKVLFRVFSH